MCLHSAHKKYKSHVSAATQGVQPTSAVGGHPQGQGGASHPPHSNHPPPTASTNTTAAGSMGQHTAVSGTEEGGKWCKDEVYGFSSCLYCFLDQNG